RFGLGHRHRMSHPPRMAAPAGRGEAAGCRLPRSAAEWQAAFPLEGLPALPPRSGEFWAQRRRALLVVPSVSALLVFVTWQGARRVPDLELARALMALIWAEVAVAWASCACVLFVEAGQVRRGPGTCYPIPPAVAQQLRTRPPGVGQRPGPAQRGRARREQLLRAVPRLAARGRQAGPQPPLRRVPALLLGLRPPLLRARALHRRRQQRKERKRGPRPELSAEASAPTLVIVHLGHRQVVGYPRRSASAGMGHE
ncbi:unnamed protein product, partial [Prorocentrum cordatum]